jgi:hypothetical protein
MYTRSVLFCCFLFIAVNSLAGCAFGTKFDFGSTDNKQRIRGPVVWGTLSECNGCVIFKEYKKTDFMFYGVAMTSNTHYELEVIETINYNMEQIKWLQNNDDMDDLQRLSVSNKLRYVKIREGYSPGELSSARMYCNEPRIEK